jgi:hypothetical protein
MTLVGAVPDGFTEPSVELAWSDLNDADAEFPDGAVVDEGREERVEAERDACD